MLQKNFTSQNLNKSVHDKVQCLSNKIASWTLTPSHTCLQGWISVVIGVFWNCIMEMNTLWTHLQSEDERPDVVLIQSWSACRLQHQSWTWINKVKMTFVTFKSQDKTNFVSIFWYIWCGHYYVRKSLVLILWVKNIIWGKMEEYDWCYVCLMCIFVRPGYSF